jgi:hypothetical protein
MNVYSGGDFWYSESISLRWKVLTSVFVGLIASTIVASYLCIRRFLRLSRTNVPSRTSYNSNNY